MVMLYDYATGRFLRNEEGEVLMVDDFAEVPKEYNRNKRWIYVDSISSIDLAYIMMENELAQHDNLPMIEVS